MPEFSKLFAASLFSTALIGAAPSNPPQVLTVSLSGQAEMNYAHPDGGTGDMDGSGTVKLSLSPDRRQVCYDFRVQDVATPMLAYIHEGPDRGIGPPVIGLFYGVGSDLSGCVPANTGRLANILAEPSLYYVSMATTEYPDGALRGQIYRT